MNNYGGAMKAKLIKELKALSRCTVTYVGYMVGRLANQGYSQPKFRLALTRSVVYVIRRCTMYNHLKSASVCVYSVRHKLQY